VHSRIHIDGITIKVRSLREKKKNFSEDESEKASEREVDFKKQRIQDWELKIQKYFEGSCSELIIRDKQLYLGQGYYRYDHKQYGDNLL